MKKTAVVCFLFMLLLLSPAQAVYAAENGSAELSAMFDSHGAVMLIIDPGTGAVVYANKAAVSFYGYDIDVLLGMDIARINTLTKEETEREMRDAAAEERNYFIFRHRLADGQTRTVEVYSYPVRYGGKDALFSVVHDVTERVMLENKEKIITGGVVKASAIGSGALLFLLLLLAANQRKLKASKRQIEKLNALRQTFIDADENLVYLKDEDLKYVFVNKAFERFYGMKAADIIGRDDFALSDTGFAEMRRSSDLAVFVSGTLVTDEVAYKNRVYKTTKFPVPMPDGKTGVGAGIEDITGEYERRKSSEKAAYRQKILLDVVTRGFASRQEQLDYVLGQVLELTGSKYGFIYTYSEEKNELTLDSWTGGVMRAGIAVHPQIYPLHETSIWSEVVKKRGPVVIGNFREFVKNGAFGNGYPDDHINLDNFMSVPVIIDEKITAVIGLANKAGDFDANDVYETTILMNGVWHAVERRQKQETVLYERNKYRQTLVSIGDGVLAADINGNVEMLNPVAEKLTGYTLAEALGRNYGEIFEIIREDGSPVGPVPQASGSGGVLLRSADGVIRSIEFSASGIKDEAGITAGMILVFRDITDKKEQAEQIEYLSFHDALTGLYNRRMFENEMKRLDTADNLPISIIMGDVNGLKLTNDIFGHAYGDMLLEKVAGVLRSCSRPGDIAARWGGDEFVLLMPQTGLREAEETAGRIRDMLSKEQIKAVRGCVSVGCDTKSEANQNILYTLGKAEEKMYTAKILEQEQFKGDVLEAIMKMHHEGDPREEEHSRRVGELCGKTGILLGFNVKRTERLKKAGYFHDIGKVILEPDLMNAGDPAGNEEYRKHPITGSRILNAFGQTADISEAVLAHHENWDGSGFPKGLAEKEIPVISRIIAVAESYERRYAAAEGTDRDKKTAAAAELRRNAGIRFDPELTEIFIGMNESGGGE